MSTLCKLSMLAVTGDGTHIRPFGNPSSALVVCEGAHPKRSEAPKPLKMRPQVHRVRAAGGVAAANAQEAAPPARQAQPGGPRGRPPDPLHLRARHPQVRRRPGPLVPLAGVLPGEWQHAPHLPGVQSYFILCVARTVARARQSTEYLQCRRVCQLQCRVAAQQCPSEVLNRFHSRV